MKKTMTAAVLLLFSMVAAFAAIAELNGKWSGVVVAPDNNEYKLTYTFKTEGDKLSGTSESTFGTSAIDNGKISDQDITFDVNVNGTTVGHKGKIYTDSISLDLDYNGTPMHTVLKRVAE